MNDPPEFSDAQLAELRRRCNLVLDLADEEVQTRHRSTKDGHGGEHEAHDLETDVAAVRPCIHALPTILRLLSQAAIDWPGFDSDEDVAGADLVDWFGPWRQRVKACLTALALPPTAAPQTALLAALGRGFVILTHNAGNDPASQYEAWAYEGPLNFDSASPIRFGLGADPHEAIDALNCQLQHHPDRPTD